MSIYAWFLADDDDADDDDSDDDDDDDDDRNHKGCPPIETAASQMHVAPQIAVH